MSLYFLIKTSLQDSNSKANHGLSILAKVIYKRVEYITFKKCIKNKKYKYSLRYSWCLYFELTETLQKKLSV